LAGEITTVLGGRDPAQIRGAALAHEHLYIDLSHEGDPEGYIRDEEAVLRELEGARDRFGLGLVIELTCEGMGRDAATLKRLSTASGVDVVCATGFYYERFHPPFVRRSSTDELTGRLLDEINRGIEDTGVRPGVIGEVGSHGPEMSAAEERCFRAAARAPLANSSCSSKRDCPPRGFVWATKTSLTIRISTRPWRGLERTWPSTPSARKVTSWTKFGCAF
jgi:phosphotriesterase-related protein